MNNGLLEAKRTTINTRIRNKSYQVPLNNLLLINVKLGDKKHIVALDYKPKSWVTSWLLKQLSADESSAGYLTRWWHDELLVYSADNTLKSFDSLFTQKSRRFIVITTHILMINFSRLLSAIWATYINNKEQLKTPLMSLKISQLLVCCTVMILLRFRQINLCNKGHALEDVLRTWRSFISHFEPL